MLLMKMMVMVLSSVAVSGAAAAVQEARPTSGNSTGVGHERRLSSYHHTHTPMNERGRPCAPSPLWDRKVDPANYEFGCREIEVISKLSCFRNPKQMVGTLCV